MKLIRHLIGICSVGYSLFLCILWASSYWPSKLYWLADLIQMAPLWTLFIPPIILAASAISARMGKVALVNIVSCGVVIFFIMGFNIPFSVIGQERTDTKQYLRVVSCNLGTHVDMRSLDRFISGARPDIIAFQEAYPNNQKVIKSILGWEKWDLSFQGYKGIASRLRIKNVEIINRDIVGGWGELAVRYDLEGNNGVIHFINIHLDTPRHGIEDVMDTGPGGLSEIKRIAKMQDTESDILSRWVMRYKNVLIAGDFNFSQANPIYTKYWSGFTNAFSRAGSGFGYTRFTRWHGVRIDHILSDGNWKAVHSEVGPDVGSDHRPVIADIEFTGIASKASETGEPAQEKLPEQGVLVYENFDISLGKFENNRAAVITIDNNTKYQGKNSMKVQPADEANDVSIGIQLDTWTLNTYPMVSFAYKIPKGNPLGLRVKTIFDDQVILARTTTNQLIDDDHWHKISIDVREVMRTGLPNVKSLKGLEFFSEAPAQAARVFWISQFRVANDAGSQN